MIVARTVAEMRAALRSMPRPLGFTPTMGALHAGHLSLVEAAKERCASVAASLFVNPAQFGRGEDLAAYPRSEARDLELFDQAGVDVVFVPSTEEMYPGGFATSIHIGGPLTDAYEGKERPGHFDGVCTVVAKLLAIVTPDVLFLGEKDAQQLAVLRRMVRDLDLPVEVAGVPTVREPDGLAMSSRNVRLTPAQRAVAPDLYRALLTGAEAARRPGAGPKDAIVAAAMLLAAPNAGLKSDDDRLLELMGQAPPGPPRFDIDYVAVVEADTFTQESAIGPRSLFIAAASLGPTRLIDNVPLAAPAAGEHAATTPASAYPVQDATSSEGRTP